MSLSNDLISQFVKITKDESDRKKETTVYGKVVKDNGVTYVKIDGSEQLTPVSTVTNARDGDRVTVLIKNHSAVITGSLSSPSANLVDVGYVSDKIEEFEIAIGDKIDVGELTAVNARIDTLQSDNVTIHNTLDAANGRIDTLETENVSVKDRLTAAEADITKLETDKLDAELAEITFATIESLNATNAEVNKLKAAQGEFEDLTTNNFTAINAEIENLDSEKLSAVTAELTYAKIADLNAANADIGRLEADLAEVDTLIFGSATGSTIQTSFSNAVIAQLGNAQIKSAMIDNVAASKITSGDIITNKVRVKSEDGKLLISDDTIQISDTVRVRVQIGKDAAGDYSINIWDSNGNLMFSEGGITDSAIKDAIIRNDMVSDTANIAAHKLDIDSLFDEINGSAKTIKSSKVYLDDESQTLEVAFKTLTEEVESNESRLTSQGTQITTIQGQIASKIWQQDISAVTDELDTRTETLSAKYSTLEQELDGLSATVASHTSDISKKADATTVTTVNNKVTSLESNLNGFKSTVSSTYATKTEFNNLEIGGRNLARNTDVPYHITGTNVSNQTSHVYYISCNWTDLIGETVTLAFDYEFSEGATATGVSIGMDAAPWTRFVVIRPAEGLSGRAFATYEIPTSTVASTTIGIRCDYLVGELNITNLMFEIANKPSAWRPAPEDMATASDVADLEDRMVSAETSITQTNETLETKAAKTEVTKAVEDTRIVGRNLIRDSRLDKDTNFWSFDTNHCTVSFDKGYAEIVRAYDADYTSRAFHNQGSNSNPLLLPDDISGSTYTLSADLKAPPGVPTSKHSSVFWRVYYDNTSDFRELTLVVPEGISETEWKRFYATYTFPTQNYTRSEVQIAINNADAGLCVRNIMLERSGKLSAWSAAPEDFATTEDFNAVKNRVSTAETKITQNANNISSVASRTTTVENRVSTAETKVNQNASSISSVATRTSANETAISELEQTADGITVRLGTAETNINAAQTAANSAQTSANNAQTSANAAQTSANNAQNTANSAKSTAEAAKKQLYHSASGTSGTAGYVGICSFTVKNNYSNRPIRFELANRGKQSSTVNFCFQNVNSTDPGLYYLQYDGGINVWAYKTATSTWTLIAQKSEAYDTIYVNDFSNNNGGVTVTWTNVHYSTLPTENITAGVLLAGKLTKSVVDDAAKTATNYLNFGSAGLVVGDHTGSSLGKNVLIDSDSVDIRNGSTVLASFGANSIELGKTAADTVIGFCGNTATLKATKSDDGYDYYDGIAFESQHFQVDSEHLSLHSNMNDTEQIYNRLIMTSDSDYTTQHVTVDSRMLIDGKRYDAGLYLNTKGNSEEAYSNAYLEADHWNGSAWSKMTLQIEPDKMLVSDMTNSGPVRPWQKILWTGVWYMQASQTATLSEAVSAQPNGIVLIFSEYIDDAASDTAFHAKFVPKKLVDYYPGKGSCFQMSSSNLAYFATKYLYISDTKIVGNDNNILEADSTSGVKRSNKRFVLRYVVGV